MHEKPVPEADLTLEQALDRLRAKEEELASVRDALEASKVALWDWELRTGKVAYSAEWKRQLGYDLLEIGTSLDEWTSRVHPDDLERMMGVVPAFLRDPWPDYKVEYRMRHKDGSWRWILTHAAVLSDAAGRPWRMLGSQIDITDKKKADESLRESQLRLQAALRAGGIGTWIWHVREDRFELDDSLLVMGGRRREDIVDYRFSSVLGYVHKDDAPFAREQFRRALRGEGELDLELKLDRPDGQLMWIRMKGCVERDESGEPMQIVGATVDITPRKRLEQELLQAQRLDAIGKLAGGVAHDFNNILTVILGQASLASMRKDLPPPVENAVREIAVAAQRAADLSTQLLAFGRRQVMQLRDVDLNEATAGAMLMFERLLGRQVRLEQVRGVPKAMVKADPEMVVQVLLNLAINAREAMPDGGALTIATSVERFDAETAAQVPGAMPGVWVCLSVTDTGTGIPREVLPHVFEPFFTTKGVGEGPGLGLSTVYGIVKQHGGWITIETETGRGTTFKVRLPASELLDAPVMEERASPASAHGHDILLVEDEPAVRTLVRLTLERFGYTVLTASDGATARAVWKEKSGDIGLLLTDVVMPGGFTGPQLASSLRETRPDLKVILSSGHGADVVGDRFDRHPGAVFLQKPYDIQKLVRTVQRLLDPVGESDALQPALATGPGAAP